MVRTLFAGSLFALLLAPTPTRAEEAAAGATVIKIATLAPQGSFWMKLFQEWASNIEKRAPGKVKIKFLPGGVAGDERDAVRKMRTGGIQGAAITGVGLGLIQPDVRVFDMPFMFKGYTDLDETREKLDDVLRKKFEEKGFVLLGWGDVGPVHLFSNTPITTLAEIGRASCRERV